MNFSSRRKYYEAFHFKPILTLYRIQMDSLNNVTEKSVEIPSKAASFTINFHQIPSMKQEQSAWFWQELDQALRSSSSKSSKSSTLEYFQKNEYERNWEHEVIQQKKVYKPTWDTWEQDIQPQSDQDNRSQVQIEIREQWQDQQ